MQLLLGHADTRTLLGTYMHVSYEDKKSSISIIENNSNVIPKSITNCKKKKNNANKWGTVTRYKGKDNYNKLLKSTAI